MKRILCYGDSITWGYNPVNGSRFAYENTWPGIMESELGVEYKVITEALTGRTTCWDLPFAPYRNGKEYLPMLLEAHSPLDLVIVMLGINDLMEEVGKGAKESSWGMIALIREILSPVFGGRPPKILIVSPPSLGHLSSFNEAGFLGKQEESKKLAAMQQIVAAEAKCEYLDSNAHIKVSDVDGVHPLEDQLEILGKEIAKKVVDILKQNS
ncbi:MAG TPA: SGNH/GDSL hydrolase family protein [Ignavibacteria bacterium]|nr:hypothetical protein [Bacteroidota bacterium]HRE10582.1 SGNH/GDSL hydrolase family protein [Ignavibacteria bacterium]HRF64869.1 SGNH/GDSL hydrolase family protein [Ignavibacteria bacterium]HRJ04751.1 SGNH/GDSL hydrolase family protein [Ignavibacteria bacterium]HRJ85129.1 SGNH/GDSL hydrolase family protein [Ignavibacteria bacterium]